MRSTVGQWMTWGLLSAPPDRPLTAALATMDEKAVHHLAVVDGTELRGLLVAEGALLALWRHPERRKSLDGMTVREVMTSAPLPMAEPETKLRDAAQRMLAYGATALIIQDGAGELTGILTARDLISALIAGGTVRHPED